MSERLLRYLASTGHIENVGLDQYRANKVSHVLAAPVAQAGLRHA